MGYLFSGLGPDSDGHVGHGDVERQLLNGHIDEERRILVQAEVTGGQALTHSYEVFAKRTDVKNDKVS